MVAAMATRKADKPGRAACDAGASTRRRRAYRDRVKK
jgi:hypothetical protein